MLTSSSVSSGKQLNCDDTCASVLSLKEFCYQVVCDDGTWLLELYDSSSSSELSLIRLRRGVLLDDLCSLCLMALIGVANKLDNLLLTDGFDISHRRLSLATLNSKVLTFYIY